MKFIYKEEAIFEYKYFIEYYIICIYFMIFDLCIIIFSDKCLCFFCFFNI